PPIRTASKLRRSGQPIRASDGGGRGRRYVGFIQPLTRAAFTRFRTRSVSSHEIHDALRGRVPPAEAELILRFSDLFLAGAPPEFFRNRSVREIADLVADSFRVLKAGRPDRVTVE